MLNQELICNVCGKRLDNIDINENYVIHKHMGYGTVYDGDDLELHICCGCMEKLIDSCAVSPVKSLEI